MNIDLIRLDLKKLIGKRHYFVYFSGRGQYEKFNGFINHVYPRIFTIVTDSGQLKSISYSDYVIKNIKIL